VPLGVGGGGGGGGGICPGAGTLGIGPGGVLGLLMMRVGVRLLGRVPESNPSIDLPTRAVRGVSPRAMSLRRWVSIRCWMAALWSLRRFCSSWPASCAFCRTAALSKRVRRDLAAARPGALRVGLALGLAFALAFGFIYFMKEIDCKDRGGSARGLLVAAPSPAPCG
jgi:hypothetical protein